MGTCSSLNKLILLLVIALLAACRMPDKSAVKTGYYHVNCPIVIGPRGAQFLTSFESAKILCNNRIEFVSVDTVSGYIRYAQDLDKNIYEAASNDSLIMVSQASNKYYAPPDSGINFIMFRGTGSNAFWLGLENYHGRFFTLGKDSVLRIVGYQENRYRDTPDGSKILMTRGTGENDFFAGDWDGKIYKAVGEEGVEQIGIFDIFWMPEMDDSKIRRAIVMTKGMNENDMWCGELDGILYIRK